MANVDDWHIKVELKLAELLRGKQPITYLEMAEFAGIPSPHRIHQLTDFLEQLIRRDVQLGQPVRAAFVVSKTSGLPADGFFDCLKGEGVSPAPSESRAAFYQRLIDAV